MTARLRLLLCFLAVSVCGPAVSHGGPVRDHVSFVDNLRARGFAVEPIGQTKVVPFDVPATGVAVSGSPLRGPATMLSFDYNDTDLGRDGQRAAEEDAREVADGARVTNTTDRVRLPSGPAHFYRRERVIVMYVGADPEMLRILVDLFGPQFAGAR
jgi:hypothetical protein